MAVGPLYVLDAELPGGLIAGAGSLRHAQTMAFTTLMLLQLFNLFNARSDEESAFRGLLDNRWLLAAIVLSRDAAGVRRLSAVSAASRESTMAASSQRLSRRPRNAQSPGGSRALNRL